MPGADPGPGEPTLSFGDLAAVMALYHEALVAHETTVNQLNVFPVPDGDTGTNMRSTLDGVLAALREAGTSDEEIEGAISRASLLSARGNSGILLAQFLRALASSLRGHEQIDAAAFARAIGLASDAARDAVATPIEGTILSVASGAARAAVAELARSHDLAEVVSCAYIGARDALWATPSQLAVLARAGVVDAGGAGLVLLFGAFARQMHIGGATGELELPGPVRRLLEEHPNVGVVGERFGRGDHASYEVMFLLDGDPGAMAAFREAWSRLGECIAIVGDDPTWNCHIHTSDIGAAIEAALAVGRPYEIRVTDLDRQVAEEGWVERELSDDHYRMTTGDDAEIARCSVIAVSNGAGLDKILRSLGAGMIVDGGPLMNPSTQELLDGLRILSSEEIVLLPNNPKVIPVAKEAAKLADRHVEVLETNNVPEAIAVMLRFDPKTGAAENSVAMGATLARVKTGEVDRASRDASTEAGPVARGEYLAIAGSHVVAVGSEIGPVTRGLVDAMLDEEHEIVTIYTGVGVGVHAVEGIVAELAHAHPNLAVEHFDGGQSHEQILVALE